MSALFYINVINTTYINKIKSILVDDMKNGLEIDKYRDKIYYKNNLFHREDGPAVEYSNGDKFWYIDGKLHREDGPAIDYDNGDKFWYFNGIKVQCKTQEEFERIFKIKAFW